jgi:hypothetical protein
VFIFTRKTGAKMITEKENFISPPCRAMCFPFFSFSGRLKERRRELQTSLI